MTTLTGSNTTPVQFQIQVHNGNRSTTANASWIGNITNNDLRFGVNNSTSMILTTTGRLGLGTTSPSAPLHVPGSNSFVFGAGGTTVYRLRTDSGATESALGPITYSVAGIFGGYIASTAMAMTSDRRLKKNIQSCPIDRVKRLYDSCEVKLYDWIESENKPGQEIEMILKGEKTQALNQLSNSSTVMRIERWELSPLKSKKYRVWVRLDTGKLRKVDFGARGYAQYRDQTPLKAFSHLDHNDEERRHRYYLRHKVDYPEPSADFYAKKFLW
ncbi:hypothetical protein F444_20560 [Phytophthora nicotianae P1976]|uniref:Peptidase S74 domain-containing protein n=1 Tax=Phytophthora nicotianae P1976 TaxID=1317066 RepID=A0A080Z461_PHYNI|nr:hypothetical protein F444_20560 [Phytophthora nicotianae P1976]